jgi:pyruvate ferredoxin oxidoreductase gamma subunit
MLEIRWHGRGGQGAKTAAMLLAQTAMTAGFEIQAFPEYGPERSGAPITAYTRISESPIRIHSGIKNPSVVVVLDAGLMDVVDVTAGLAQEEGLLLVNSAKDPDQVQENIKHDIARLVTVDATAIAREETGSDVPNMPMLGAFIQIEKIVSLEKLIESVKEKLSAKLGEKKAQANIACIKRAFQEVRTP